MVESRGLIVHRLTFPLSSPCAVMAGSNVEALKAQAAVVRGINASLRRVSEQLDSMMDALDRTVELSDEWVSTWKPPVVQPAAR